MGPFMTQSTHRYTPSQHAGGYDSQDDSGDDLFNEYGTVDTVPLQGQFPHRAPQAQTSQSQDTYTTQPTQIVHTGIGQRQSGSSVVQVPASSPMQPARAPFVTAMNRGSLNGGLAIAPMGTTLRRPITASQMRQSQHSQAENLSDDEQYQIEFSDDERSTQRSDIKPSIIQNGRLLSTTRNATTIPESPNARPNAFAQHLFNATTSQKRSADIMANAYSSSHRPSKQIKQTGPARAQPVEVEMKMDDVQDWGLRKKIREILAVYPNLTIRRCHDALARCKGSRDDAMDFLAEDEERLEKRKAAVDLTGSDDELTTKSPMKAPLKHNAKRQLDVPTRTIADKWSSTQALPRPSLRASLDQSQASENSPVTPLQPRRKRLIRRSQRHSPPPVSPSSPDPLSRPGSAAEIPQVSQVTQVRLHRRKSKRVVSDEDDSGIDNEDDSEDEQEDEIAVSHRSDRLLRFINTCTARDLADLSNQSPEAVDLVIAKRPFSTLDEIRDVSVESSTTTKTGRTRTTRRPVGENLMKMAEEMWMGYEAVDDLVSHCEELGRPIAAEMKKWGFDAFGTAQIGELQLVDMDFGAKESASGHDSGIGTPSSTTDDGDAGSKAITPNGKERKALFLQQPKMMSKDLVMKDYQVAGLNWLALLFSKKLSCILADDMGLGKTCQVIAFFAHLHEIGITGPHVVVVPGSTLENWLREFKNFCPELRVEPYYGLQDERADHRLRLEQEIKYINVVVTTYDMAAKHEDAKFLRKYVKPVVCVYDEGHALKNSQSKRYKELMKIPAQFRLLLTGTPLQNNLQELISLLAFIMPDVFRDAQDHLQYIFKYKAKTTDKDHAALLSSQRVSRARSMMTPFILRRKKHQVLKHLPQKVRRVEYCDLLPSQKSIYDAHVAQVQQILANRMAGLPQDAKEKTNVLMKLRQAAIHPLLFRTIFSNEIIRKMSIACLDEPKLADRNPDLVYEDMTVMTDWELHRFCQDYPDTMSAFALKDSEWMQSGKVGTLVRLLKAHHAAGARTLVFSQFTMVMNILEEVLETIEMPYFRLDGATRMDQRQDLIDAFYAEESVPVFMLSTKAGGAGINLACANKVIIFDSSFNPQDDVQAENRAHRVGQLRDVEVVRLVSRGTIEEQIHALGESKLALDERVAGAAGDDSGHVDRAEKDGLKIVEKMMLRQLEGGSDGKTSEKKTGSPILLSSDDDEADSNETNAKPTPGSSTPSDLDVVIDGQPTELTHRAKGEPRNLAIDFLQGLRARGLNVSKPD